MANDWQRRMSVVVDTRATAPAERVDYCRSKARDSRRESIRQDRWLHRTIGAVSVAGCRMEDSPQLLAQEEGCDAVWDNADVFIMCFSSHCGLLRE